MASTEPVPGGRPAPGPLWAFVVLTRPVFLLGAALLYALGAVAAVRLSGVEFRPTGYLLGQLMVTAVQLTAQYLNERFDVATDRRNENRTLLSGGSGVLPSGALTVTAATGAAVVSAAIAGVAAILVARVSPPAAVIGAAALLGSWAYSAPPLRLVATPLGEVLATAIVVGMVPTVGALMQRSTVPAGLVAAIVVLAPLHGGMLLAFGQPDIAPDAASGKRTTPVRIGEPATVSLQTALVCAAGVAAVPWFGGTVGGTAWALVGAPAAAVQVWAARRRRYAVLTPAAAGAFALAATGLALGLS